MGASASDRSNPEISDQHFLEVLQTPSYADVVKKNLGTRFEQITPDRLLQDEHQRIASLKPKDWKSQSLEHREKFEDLLEIWRNDPQSITIVCENGVCFQKQFLIGTGSYGTEVYICLGSDGIERAIKRLPKLLCSKKLLKNELDILTSRNAVNSSRIVNYWFYDETSNADFCYLILNLYEQNLEDYIKEKGEEITKAHARKMIRQVLEGLEALHTREPRILHRDLKPTNILVDMKGNLVLSDFGIGRFFQEQGATTYHTNHEAGSHGWVAFECVDWTEQFSDTSGASSDASKQLKWKEKSDIQVAGMLAFYIFTKGRHPFGKKIEQMVNLCNNKPVGLKMLDDPVLKDLLSQMLAQTLNKRPYVEQALKHPYFLSPNDQIKFLEVVCNEPKFGSKSCTVSSKLEQPNPLLESDWKAVFDPDDLKILCGGGQKDPSCCNGRKYSQCLRLIRNALQHHGGKLHKLTEKGRAESLQEYFLNLFPTLPLVVYQIIRDEPAWNELPALTEFFPKKENRKQSDEGQSLHNIWEGFAL